MALWRRRIVAAFTERLALKGTAIALSVVLWFVLSAKEPTYEVIPVKFAPQLDSSLVLRDPPLQIHAVVAGTSSELIKLFSSPPVIDRAIAADAPDTLVMDLSPRDVKMPPGVNAFVEEVQPHSVTLRFEPMSTGRVPVRSNVTVTANPLPNALELRFEPAFVEVSGPRLAVLRVSAVSTVRTSIPYDSLPHLVDLDTARLGTRVRPAQVKVKIIPLPLVKH